MLRSLALALLVSCVRAPAADPEEPPRRVVERSFRGWLEEQATPRPLGMPEDAHVLLEVARFYSRRGYRVAWFDEDGPTPDVAALLAALGDAGTHGLNPDAYAVDLLTRRLERPLRGQARLAHDYALTYAALSYAEHLVGGRVRPEQVDVDWAVEPRRADTAAILEHALATDAIAPSFEALAPRHAGYAGLRRALARYRAHAARGFPSIPSETVRPGEPIPSTLANAVEERLALEGYLDRARVFFAPLDPDSVGPLYDERLEAAVRAFQADRALEPHGALDEGTLRALAEAADRRVAELERNLERWRWLPDDLGARHLRVNLPAARLALVEGGAIGEEMAVSLGELARRSPLFADALAQVVLHPAQADALPFQLRQRPTNPLGRVAFLFDGQPWVALHEAPTEPGPELAGCVGVERPVELAAALLDGWSARRLGAALKAGERVAIPLQERVPVYLVYFTAEVGPDGAEAFHPDPLGVDAAHAAALADAWSGWRSGARP